MLQPPLRERLYREVGRFELRNPDPGRAGVVIGVPHGSAEQGAIEFAQAIRDGTGGGLVVAYEFKSKRIPVAQPLVQTSPVSWPGRNSTLPGSVYPEFKNLLQSAAAGPIKFYVGLRLAEGASPAPHVEVASSGFSFEQLIALKQVFAKVRDRRLRNLDGVAKVDIAINPLDDISWNSYGVRNHGVLMVAEKGLILSLPKVFTESHLSAVYREILTEWVQQALTINLDSSSELPAVESKQMSYGRIDSISAAKESSGVVIAAPHGSFDWYTAELVEEISYRTAFPAVITRGFTPTECGGWRINVNRPTERRYPTDSVERTTERAKDVYEQFKTSVFALARGPLNIYIDVHQNVTQSAIEVATHGITREQATAIKSNYQKIRDRMLGEVPEVAKVNLIIEPIDQVEIGAWAAKDHGMLRLAKSSLHFELPAQRIFYRDRTRRIYTKILSDLVSHLVKSQDGVVDTKGASPVPVVVAD